MLDKKVICVLGGLEQDNARFHHATQIVHNLKLTFTFGIFHLTFLNCDSP